MPSNCGTREDSLDKKEIKPVNLKEINSEYSLEELMLTQASLFWSPDVNSQLIGKVPDAGKD